MTQDSLDEILVGYLACALWTEEERILSEATTNCNHLRDFEVEHYSEEAQEEATKDIMSFIFQVGQAAAQEMAYKHGLSQIGHDLWLTRNGHGSGFWERGYENQNIIMYASKSLGEKSLYFDGTGLQFE